MLRRGRAVPRRSYYFDVERLEAHDSLFELSTGAVVVFTIRAAWIHGAADHRRRARHVERSASRSEPLARTFDATTLARVLTGRRTS